jgi:DNA-binding transcriptional LysR family regulator
VEHGYSVEICSPEGGKLEGDKWSDPRDESGYSAHDLLSLGFISSPEHMKFVQNSRPLSSLNVEDLDAVLFVGGQGPMYYTDLLSLVASGAGVAIVPTSLRAIRRAGVLFRPLRERPMTQLDMVWRPDAASPVLREFLKHMWRLGARGIRPKVG